MKLFEVPRHSRIKLQDGRELDFQHIDGMYSYCTDDKGNAAHIPAWADVEIVSPYEQKPEPMSKMADTDQNEQRTQKENT
jgi:hypothetical protein